jgi:hypothetical protein
MTQEEKLIQDLREEMANLIRRSRALSDSLEAALEVNAELRRRLEASTQAAPGLAGDEVCQRLQRD